MKRLAFFLSLIMVITAVTCTGALAQGYQQQLPIAPTFEMALMKAVRGAEIGLDTLNAAPLNEQPLRERLAAQDDRRIFTVFEALKAGVSIAEIYDITKIDPYFLEKLPS